MRRLYSLILLFSLAVGIMQPVLPMIEYQLFEGNIIEMLTTEACTAEHSGDHICCALNTPGSDRDGEADQNLLDLDYYPLALQMTGMPDPVEFPIRLTFHLPDVNNVPGPTYLPSPPPPRLG